jgi:hypothetical protein
MMAQKKTKPWDGMRQNLRKFAPASSSQVERPKPRAARSHRDAVPDEAGCVQA